MSNTDIYKRVLSPILPFHLIISLAFISHTPMLKPLNTILLLLFEKKTTITAIIALKNLRSIK